jgi:quercetin dioxygenase-like cupin family protein
MPHVTSADAPVFELPGVRFTGLVAPSRGSTELCAWRIEVAPGAPANPHRLDREEVFVATAGSAVIAIDGEDAHVSAGDAVSVPAGAEIALSNPHDDPFRAVVCIGAGFEATLADGTPFGTPPWAV